MMQGHEPRAGVIPLRVLMSMSGESDYPESLAAFSGGATGQKRSTAPEGFTGDVDALISPRLLSQSVLVDLSLPDKVLRQDFDQFLKRRRAEFAAIGGEQPHARSLRVS